ncbi:hypothetical protein [Photobacterium toruni]|uniref:Uncharacterized protein n=1 Tax=Photobacterium toruni TaxID=1935446 RepID=A0A1T4R8J9_9GAMM|nr:hypothetical protein [Photobacterium toruni]SKA12352.1 hypothetical protein CZ814_01229 [Photobacterium toruni]
MKVYLLRMSDRKRQIISVIITILLMTISLFTSGLTSALCDLMAFSLLLFVLWLKIREPLITKKQ